MTTKQPDTAGIAEALSELGCASGVRSVALEIVAAAQSVHLWSGTTDSYVGLTGDADSAIGVYVNPGRLSLALDPQQARQAAADCALSTEQKSAATWYVLVEAGRLADPALRAEVVRLGVSALERSCQFPAHHPSASAKANLKPVATCPRHHIQLLPSGACPHCLD